jgi:putative aminopeptidase
MKFRTSFACAALAAFIAIPAAVSAQDEHQTLAKFVETPAVSGYEQTLGKEISAQLAKFKPQTDTLGDVLVTVGSGAPHKLIATLMDEPGYVVSGITPDGFLRVQRLPQTAPNPVFDTLYAAQPIVIQTRSGKTVHGVVAALSTHLQPGRINPPQPNNLDDVYIDIGASSAAEVHAAGVDVLDPLVMERQMYDMGFGRMTGVGIGDRFGCAALVEMLRHLDASQVKGTVTVAFLAQEWTGTRGVRRLMASNNPLQSVDEMVYVGPLLSRRAAAGRGRGNRGGRGGAEESAVQNAAPNPNGGFITIAPKLPDGSGALIGTTNGEPPADGPGADLLALAQQNNIKAASDIGAPLIASTAAAPSPLPKRFAHIGISTQYLATPAAFIDGEDLTALTRLLEFYVSGHADTQPMNASAAAMPRPPMPKRPTAAPTYSEVVSKLVESYGVSRHEKDVHDTVLSLLPAWAKTTTDDSGNIWLHWGSGAKNSKSVVFVAHMDEIGYDVRKIDDDGKIEVISRGGGITYFFGGHAVMVHTPDGDRPGVLEPPVNWDQPSFEWPTGRGAPAAAANAAGNEAEGEGGRGGRGEAGRGEGGAQAGAAPGGLVWKVDVGARSAAEVAQLGITTSDWVTVPKKFRKLAADRANGRSFDDRVGDTALIEATWALGPQLPPGRDVTFIWSTGEEIGLVGAGAAAKQLATEGKLPPFVFAIDTFVSSDSPLESKRFADALLGHGFVVRAVDNSDITERQFSDRVVSIAKANSIPAQYGVTGGGNDGSMFVPFGSIDVGLGWPLRYSHSPGEVIDLRDLDALGHIVVALSKSW